MPLRNAYTGVCSPTLLSQYWTVESHPLTKWPMHEENCSGSLACIELDRDGSGTHFAKTFRCGLTLSNERRKRMRKQAIISSALLCSGTLALGASTLWSQTSATQSGRDRGMSQPRPTSSSGTSAGTGQLSSTEITQAQQALKAKGHDPGPVDGVMSSKTQQAIKAFQQANGLLATGTLDSQTAAALGVPSVIAAPARAPREGPGAAVLHPAAVRVWVPARALRV